MELELPIKIPPLKKGYDQDLDSRRVLSIYILRVLPQVRKLLKDWNNEARRIPDPTLRFQALASLDQKAFHCQGGAVYAVPWESSSRDLLQFIIAYQTLCDYLDNLCDRTGSTDGQAFEQLHLSLFDALDPVTPLRDYYRYYGITEDGGYVNNLVTTCQQYLSRVSDYDKIRDSLIWLAGLYRDLQVKKHLSLNVRHEKLSTWAKIRSKNYDGLLWPEFAAASGSTLAVFALVKDAGNLTNGAAEKIIAAYFPWICGLHILLDYFIDRDEDRAGGDLNFTFYYDSEEFTLERLKLFVQKAHQQARELPGSAFHQTVTNGLLAMYLSDRKIKQHEYGTIAAALLDTGGPPAWNTYRICRLVRKFL